MKLLTRNTLTGLIASYAPNVVAIMPNLEVITEEPPCTDCVVDLSEIQEQPEEEVAELKEPAPRKRTKK